MTFRELYQKALLRVGYTVTSEGKNGIKISDKNGKVLYSENSAQPINMVIFDKMVNKFLKKVLGSSLTFQDLIDEYLSEEEGANSVEDVEPLQEELENSIYQLQDKLSKLKKGLTGEEMKDLKRLSGEIRTLLGF